MSKRRSAQATFEAGILGDKMSARVDQAIYNAAVERLENFYPLPEGPAQYREGFYFVGNELDSISNKQPYRIITATFSDGTSWVLRLASNQILFYEAVAGIPFLTFKGATTETIPNWLFPRNFYVDYQQIGDTIEIVFGGVPGLFSSFPVFVVTYVGGTQFFRLANKKFGDSPPWMVKRRHFSGTMTLSADANAGEESDGGGKYFKLYNGGPFFNIHGGTLIVNNVEGGKSFVRWPLRVAGNLTGKNITGLMVENIFPWGDSDTDDFHIEGGGAVKIDPSDTGFPGEIIDLEASEVPKVACELLEDGTNGWTVAAGNANIFFYNNASSMRPGSKPDNVYVDSEPYDEKSGAALPALEIGEWWWGDDAADAIGANTIYIRIPGNADPDTLVSSVASQVRVFYVMSDPDYGMTAMDELGLVGERIILRGGQIKIEGLKNVEKIKCQVVRELDTSNATFNWEIYQDAFNSIDGHPDAVTVHENRTVYARGEEIWLSDSGLFNEFTIGTLDTDSIQYRLNVLEKHSIRWIQSRDILIAGTDIGEFAVGKRGEKITPSNMFARLHTKYGSFGRGAHSVIGMNNILFADNTKKRIRELTFEFGSDSYFAANLNKFASDFEMRTTNFQLAFQPGPTPILWAIDQDQKLLGMMYSPEERSFAWFRFNTGVDGSDVYDGEDFVRAIGVVLFDGGGSILVAEIKREGVNAQIEVLTPLKDVAATPDFSNATYLDSAALMSVNPGSGFSRFDGQTISYITNSDPDKTGRVAVAGGSVTIPAEDFVANQTLIGFPYNGIIKMLKLEVGGERGLARALLKRISRVYLSLIRSFKGKVGPDTSTLESVKNADTITTDEREVDYKEGWERKGQVVVVQDSPLPFVLAMLQADGNTSDD